MICTIPRAFFPVPLEGISLFQGAPTRAGAFVFVADGKDDDDSLAAAAVAVAEGKENDTPRHWTMGASMAQERGATSGNLKTVSLSTCAAKLFGRKEAGGAGAASTRENAQNT